MSDLETRLADLERRLGELEDVNAIRRLHWAYGYYIDFNRAEDVVQLFAADGAVVFLSGEYRGHEGVRRLYGTWFQNYFTKGVDGPVYGFLLDHFQMQDIITVAADRQTAKGRFRGLLMGGSHESRDYKPEGLPLQFLEAGVYENDYVREQGIWKIKRLDYMMQWQADYETGWSRTVAHLQPATRPILKIRSGPTLCFRTLACARPGRIGTTCRCISPIRALARCWQQRPEGSRRVDCGVGVWPSPAFVRRPTNESWTAICALRRTLLARFLRTALRLSNDAASVGQARRQPITGPFNTSILRARLAARWVRASVL